MLPMQLYLYKKFINGEFFYSMDFGLGGDYFTDLSYYYSTNIIYFINIICVWFLDVFFNFKTDSISFWAKNAFYVSIVKSAIAIIFSYLYFRKIRLAGSSAMLAAFLFVMSAIYFRFTLYWSFFSDVFIFYHLCCLELNISFRIRNILYLSLQQHLYLLIISISHIITCLQDLSILLQEIYSDQNMMLCL